MRLFCKRLGIWPSQGGTGHLLYLKGIDVEGYLQGIVMVCLSPWLCALEIAI